MKKINLPIVGECEYEENNKELTYFEPHKYHFQKNNLTIENYTIPFFIIRMYNVCEEEIEKVKFVSENIINILEKSSSILKSNYKELKKEIQEHKEYEIWKYETVFSNFSIDEVIDNLKIESFSIYTNSKNSFIEIDYILGYEFDAVLVVNLNNKMEYQGYYMENG